MRGKFLYIVLGVVVILFVITQFLTPQPMDWNPSYSRYHKTPYGGFAISQLLSDVFPNDSIHLEDRSPYDAIKEIADTGVNYIIIEDVYNADRHETNKLLDFVRAGNQVFISANEFTGAIADTFLLETIEKEYFQKVSRELYLYTGVDSLDKAYNLRRGLLAHYFTSFSRGTPHGGDQQDRVNFLRIVLGDGNLYLHSAPIMFSNYMIVNDTTRMYASTALSFLPEGPVYWDEYYKPGRARIQSPLKYILNEASLQWAWILILAGVLIYILFQGKRVQRIIPILDPPRNASLEFAETVGQLYFENSDHRDLAVKKIKFFAEYIRSRLHMSTQTLNEDFYQRLSSKSGFPLTKVQTLFGLIQAVSKSPGISESQLIRLDHLIEEFYKISK